MLSRFYDYKFTADLYFSLNPYWNFLGKGVPKKCSERVSCLLSDDEAEIYLDDLDDGIKDDWWQGLSSNQVDAFLATVKLSEQRIMTQIQLLKDIQSSDVIKDITKEIYTVIQNVSNELSDKIDFSVKEIPKKPIGGVPLVWFQHSYQIMHETRPDTINKLGTKALALNAWIMSHF